MIHSRNFRLEEEKRNTKPLTPGRQSQFIKEMGIAFKFQTLKKLGDHRSESETLSPGNWYEHVGLGLGFVKRGGMR